MTRIKLVFFLAYAALLPMKSAFSDALPMYGDPKYAPDFQHFDYTNPNAPIGGHLRLPAFGSFDSLNPFIVKGTTPKAITLLYQSLLIRSADEPFTLYPGIAKVTKLSPDRRFMSLALNPRASFSDGTQITAEDVIFSLTTLRDQGRPNHRQYYSQVETITAPDAHHLDITFKEGAGQELPLIIGLMPILSKQHFEHHDFNKSGLTPPLGSGPYTVLEVEPGRRITFARNPDFWGWDLPAYKGRHNFEKITYEFFRDTDIAFQAFRAKDLDLYLETDPAKWILNRGSDAFIAKALPRKLPPYVKALVFNTRRAPFDDPAVRDALSPLFDFEWVNENLLHGLYQRTESFFDGTTLASPYPLRSAVMEKLTPYLNELPSDILTEKPPFIAATSSKDMRKLLRSAKKKLQKAGWTPNSDGMLQDAKGNPFNFEILLNDSRYEKILAHFIDYLSKVGVNAKIRIMDSAGYQARITDYDFDMMIAEWSMSLSPGNEQQFYWSSDAADTPGTRNYPGIKSPAVDKMIANIITAKDEADLIAASQALDRMLMFGRYFIPLYHSPDVWIYHQKNIGHPATLPDQGLSPDSWFQLSIDD